MPNEINKINVNGTDYNVRDDSKVLKSGDTMTGNLVIANQYDTTIVTTYSHDGISTETSYTIASPGDIILNAVTGYININSGSYTAINNTIIPKNTTLQTQLVSGENIKTINGTSLLGSGNIEIAGAGGDVTGPNSSVDGDIALFNGTSGKVIKTGTLKTINNEDLIVDNSPINSISDLVVGKTYHFNGPLTSGYAGYYIICSSIFNIITTAPEAIGFSAVPELKFGQFFTSSCSLIKSTTVTTSSSSYPGYGDGDFEFDFVYLGHYEQSAGLINTNLIPYISNAVNISLVSEPKLENILSNYLKYTDSTKSAANIEGDLILGKQNTPGIYSKKSLLIKDSTKTFTVDCGSLSLGNYNKIDLNVNDFNNGIYFDSYDNGFFGYSKLPVNDGSTNTAAGRYTIATREWVNDQLPDTSDFIKKDGSIAMTGNLYIQSNPTTLVDGETYHLHIPAGTNMQTVANGQFICASSISNIVTSIPTSSRQAGYSNRIGCVAGITTWYGVVGSDSSTGYNMVPASSDFDCDFVFSSSSQWTDPYNNLLQFVTGRVKFATLNDLPDLSAYVQKSGDTMSGKLLLAQDTGAVALNHSGYGQLNLLRYNNGAIEIGTNSPLGTKVCLGTDNFITQSSGSGICIQNQVNNNYGYYKFPVNDGSTDSNRYTLATQEYVDDEISTIPSFTSITENQTTNVHSTTISNTVQGTIPAIQGTAKVYVVANASGNAYVALTANGTSSLGTQQTVRLDASHFSYNDDDIATEPWVQSNPKYTITVSSGVMTVKENY